MPARGAVFPEIAATEYRRRTRLIQTRVAVPYGDPQINVPHPFGKDFMWWNSTFLTPADLSTLSKWHRDNGTTYHSLYDPPGWGVLPVELTLVGTIIAGTMTYTLPGKELTTISLWDNVTTLIDPSRYTVSVGTGSEGETQITFNVGQLPVAGHTLHYTANAGRKKFTVWCNSEEFPRAYLEGDLFTLEEPLQFEERVVQ